MKKAKEAFLNAKKENKTKKEIINILIVLGYSNNSANWYYYKLLKELK